MMVCLPCARRWRLRMPTIRPPTGSSSLLACRGRRSPGWQPADRQFRRHHRWGRGRHHRCTPSEPGAPRCAASIPSDVARLPSPAVTAGRHGGGGIRADDTHLTLTMLRSAAIGPGYARWRNLADSVTLNAARSVATHFGSGGGIYARLCTLNSTVSGNSTAASGGGISGYSVTLTDSTVSGNSAVRYGGGISGNYMMLSNSIVAGNGDSGPAPDILARSPPATATTSSAATSRQSVRATWRTCRRACCSPVGCADNGGPTQTIALRDAADNPALAGADPATPPPPTSVARRGRSRRAPIPTSARSSSGRRSPSPCLRSTWSTAPRAARSCAARPVPT